jgi:cupin 2 domain-containing protein
MNKTSEGYEEDIMQVQNLYGGVPRHADKEIFETLLETEAFRLERILSTGRASPPGFWYDQDQDEWVALLSGEAELLFEEKSERVLLRPGDFLLIPARKRHRVERTSLDAIWLALHFDR